MIRLCALAAAVVCAAAPLASRASDLAPAAELPVQEIVQRASAQLGRKPKKLRCNVELRALELDSLGKPTDTEERALIETWRDGVAEQGLPYQRSSDGKPLTADELAKANQDEAQQRAEMKQHEENGEGGHVDAPLEAAQVPRHKFTLLRRDQLDGRPVYVLAVAPQSLKPDERVVTREGTIYVDAQTFVPLKLDTHALPLPRHADRMDLQEEFALTAAGETVPKFLSIEIKGGVLFFTRTYRVETRWTRCE
jgi:hypothetical protein